MTKLSNKEFLAKLETQNRLDQLDYKNAIAQELPIGSGRIEGGHRHIIQARLKISEAWWLEESAQSMLALRTARVNSKETIIGNQLPRRLPTLLISPVKARLRRPSYTL